MGQTNIEFTHTEEINEKNIYFEEGSDYGFLTLKINNNEITKHSYKNFTISSDEIIDDNGVHFFKVYINNDLAKDTLLNALKDDEFVDFWEMVMLIEDAFAKKKSDIKKFRGDLSEALFLYLVGGEKYFKEDSVDIIFDGDMIEIKSFSLNKREITISNQQVENNVLTYAVGIKFDNEDGKTILDITDGIEGNDEFKKYIHDTYAETFIGKNSKYSVSRRDIKDITEFIKNIKLNEYVVEARVRLI